MKYPLQVGLLRHRDSTPFELDFEQLTQYNGIEQKATNEQLVRITEYLDGTAWKALKSGEVVALAIPQHESPLELPDGFQYFCLTKLPERKRIIVCAPSVYREDNDGKLADGTQVIVDSEASGKQILWINQKLKYKVDSVESYKNPGVWAHHHALAVLMFEDQFYGEAIGEETFRIIRLHPNEFPEPAGSGKLVWVAHKESFQMMKIIRQHYHHPEIVPCANTERKIYKTLSLHTDAEIRVRCYQDSRHFYHVKAVLIAANSDHIFTHTMSQSTHHLLAEKMTTVLLNYINKEKDSLCI